MRRYSFYTLFLLFFLLPQAVYAIEVRVVDALGLTRAVQHYSKPVTINIEVEAGQSVETLELKASGAVDVKIVGSQIDSDNFRFSAVPAGSWSIVTKPKSIKIKSVKINKD